MYRAPQLPRVEVLLLDLATTPAMWGDCFFRHAIRVRAGEAKLEQDVQDALASISSLPARSQTQSSALTLNGDEVATLRATHWDRLEPLAALSLKRNRLTALTPSAIGQLRGLRLLRVEENSISYLPDVIGQLSKLEALHLARNRISGLSDTLHGLKALHTLDLSDNLLESLPSSLAELGALTNLTLSGNRFVMSLPDVIARLTQLEQLDLRRNKLSTVKHTTLKALSRMRTLHLGQNGLYLVAESVAALTQLTVLELADNALETLPDGVGQLRSLRTLLVSGNKLRKLPPSICQLASLETLDARSNRLTHLPASIGLLGSLIRLQLSDNNITELPLSVQSLSALEELLLARNQLKSLSHGLGQCSSLHVLDIQGNILLAELPSTLSYLRSSLQQLLLDGCTALRTPPPEVQRQGTEAVLGFLHDLLGDTDRVYRFKLLVVGQENVGKTTTITQLVRKWTRASQHTLFSADRLKAPNISTDGIDIGDFTFPLDDAASAAAAKERDKAVRKRDKETKDKEKEKPVTVSVWDFAGQDVYYTTHQAPFRRLFDLIFILS